MTYAIQILEAKLQDLKDKRKLSRKLLRRKTGSADFLREALIRWDSEDKLKIASVKKGIKQLRQS